MPTTIVTDATFEAEVLRSDVPVVVDFWAAWCGPCRQVAPVLEQLSEDYAGRARIVKVDADANPQTVAAAGVVSIPTLSFYVDGALVRSLIGAKPRQVVAAQLDELLAPAHVAAPVTEEDRS